MARPRTVLAVALVFFALAAAAGIIIVVRTEYWWLLAVGAVAFLAGWFYTGGKRPYGYAGLGELAAFLFFGLVATVGTTYVLSGEFPFDSWITGAAVGFLAAAALLVNNLRDREQDILAGKRTLAVLIGDRASRILFAVLVLLPFGVLAYYTLLFEYAGYVYFALLAAVPAAVITILAKTPAEFIIALRLTVLTSLAFGLGLGAAIAF
jgi:1,4-dihydroxy-2-naphthoate octaprenyltransferase